MLDLSMKLMYPIAKRSVLTFILLILATISLVCNSHKVHARTETESADNFQLQTYLTEEQALALVFPECDDIVTDEFIMTPEEKRSLEKHLARRLYEDGFKVYIGKNKGVIQGYAMITEEIGKFHPFTFIVGVKPNGKISNIAVLIYRESRGGDVARKRFLFQFIGKSIKNPIRLNKDIINITGATMSVQCMCAGVRKVLVVVHEYYLRGKRDANRTRPKDISAVTREKGRPVGESSKFQNAKNKEKANERKGQGLKKGTAARDDGKDVSSERKLLKQTRMIMGTFAEISVYSNDEKTAGKAIDAALDEMERMDRIMSNYKDDSELSLLNKRAAKSPVPCDKELLDVINMSQYYSELSEGAFDITVSPIVALWGFFHEKGHIPPDKEIEDILPAISYKNIVIDKGAGSKNLCTISYKNNQTQIDLGGIGKGYAVDKALEIMKKFDIDNACINLGGNIYVLGAPSSGKNVWKVGVQHPRNNNEILGYLELKDEATATSGDYERFFEIQGKRYSHIIDPRTGRPVSGVITTTIVAPTATEVDALSTSVFVLGPEKGLKMIDKIPGADALIMYEGKDGKIMIDMTRGFKEKFRKTKNLSVNK